MVKTKFFPSFASIYTGKGFDPGGGGGGCSLGVFLKQGFRVFFYTLRRQIKTLPKCFGIVVDTCQAFLSCLDALPTSFLFTNIYFLLLTKNNNNNE